MIWLLGAVATADGVVLRPPRNVILAFALSLSLSFAIGIGFGTAFAFAFALAVARVGAFAFVARPPTPVVLGFESAPATLGGVFISVSSAFRSTAEPYTKW